MNLSRQRHFWTGRWRPPLHRCLSCSFKSGLHPKPPRCRKEFDPVAKDALPFPTDPLAQCRSLVNLFRQTGLGESSQRAKFGLLPRRKWFSFLVFLLYGMWYNLRHERLYFEMVLSTKYVALSVCRYTCIIMGLKNRQKIKLIKY